MDTAPATATSIAYLAECSDSALDNYCATAAKASDSTGVIALVAEANQADIACLQAAARRHQLVLLGAVAPALIYRGRFVDSGIILLNIGNLSHHALLPLPENTGVQEIDASVAALIAQCRLADSRESDTLYLFIDGLVPYIASYIDALYLRLADRISYVGTNVGSGSFKPMACLFDNDRVIGHGLLAFLRPQDGNIALDHGYCMPPETHYATATSGNKIQSIDWRPAFEVYGELVAARHGIALTRENFYDHAVHMPFGMLRLDGNPIVRIPVAVDPDGAIYCVGEVAENSMLTLLDAPTPGSSTTIDGLVHRLAADDIQSLFVMYCAGRRMHLGADADRELAELQARLPHAVTFGLLSLGEIGESVHHSYPALHNGSIVCCSWDRR